MVTRLEIFILTFGSIGLALLVVIGAVLWRRGVAMERLIVSLLTRPVSSTRPAAPDAAGALLRRTARDRFPTDDVAASWPRHTGATPLRTRPARFTIDDLGRGPPLASPTQSFFQTFFQAYFTGVFDAVRRCGVPAEEAESVTEEVFVALFKDLDPWVKRTTVLTLQSILEGEESARPSEPPSNPDRLKN